jgi:hypothetical protein
VVENLPSAERTLVQQKLLAPTNLEQNTNGKKITKTQGVCGDAQLLQDYPHITATDLANAWIYASTFPEEIATVIQANSDTTVLEQG